MLSDPPAGWTAGASRLLAVLFLIVAAEALFSVPKLTWDLAMGGGAPGIALGIVIAVAAVAALWVGRWRLAALLQTAGGRLATIPHWRWLAMVIAVGLALQVVWALLFPAPLTSDARAYYDLAARLTQGLTYQTPKGEWAFWPPGYPFLLLVQFKVFGIGLPAVKIANFLLFAATVLVVYPLARRFGEGTARLSTLLLALWPNLIASAGVATKEMILIFLLPAMLLLYLRAGEQSSWRGAAMRLATGLMLGYATLTQPGVMLLAVAFLAYEILLRTPLLRAAAHLALLALGMALVILPWTWRNYRALDAPVLVSTNGGDTFYRANNPLATGGWIKDCARSLKGYDELTQDRLGYEWGKEWIRDNPGQFLLLALKKQILFLGDDANGLYEIKRGGRIGGALYALAKLVTNAWWWGIWALALAAFLVHWSTPWHQRAEIVLFLLTILYFWAIDSVFISGSRHHTPLVAILAILAAAGPSPPRPSSPIRTPTLPGEEGDG
jgi:4-amino-4-deoxy-L-arabinose transferase-like glycosyltransferase